ncbi:putative serpin-Z6A [Lolium rigidum]|uniref:putative serpin-Z6A n=1 Tax=Lolium rigidum TaxID=89674 RepID=UPI001F5DAADA|nr:putative serpin-Z6A [Lolium rigidum]
MEKEAMRPSKKARGRGTSIDSGGLTALALRLANKFSSSEEHKDQNIMFSPLSIYTALGLVAAGARGTTLDELLAVLGATSRDEVGEIVQAVSERALAGADHPSGPLVVTFACGVWCQKDLSLKPAYRQAAVESYNAEARAVDLISKFKDARKEINSWVSKATKNLVTSVLPPGSVDVDTRVVLTNAIYFKGEWEEAFLPSRTKEHRFYRLDGSAVHVPFMSGIGGGDYRVGCHDGFKVLKLPYKQAAKGAGARYSMCVFLPTAREGLRNLADEMASGGSGFLFDHMPRWTRSVTELRLPKFKLSFFCSMKKALKSLGLRAAFSTDADLSDMVEANSGDINMRVEDVFHKAVVEVNEEGTKAAASTAVTMVLECDEDPEPPVDFVADHPFAFFIVEELSGAVLFAGHVLDPSTNTE